MFGLINNIVTTDQKRDELVKILIESSRDMPGCRSYIVAVDPQGPNGIWVTEVWDNESDQQASLDIPHVKAAIQQAGPMVFSFKPRVTTTPLGGHGLL